MGKPVNRSEVMAQSDAVVVLCGDDAQLLGRTAAALQARGMRVAVTSGATDPDTLVELVNELFPRKPELPVR